MQIIKTRCPPYTYIKVNSKGIKDLNVSPQITKVLKNGWAWWLTPVTPAAWEAEVGAT